MLYNLRARFDFLSGFFAAMIAISFHAEPVSYHVHDAFIISAKAFVLLTLIDMAKGYLASRKSKADQHGGAA